jgi:hypothetical protein
MLGVFAVATLLLTGCVSTRISKKTVSDYQDLFDMEQGFTPELLQLDPNKGATYVSSQSERAAGVMVDLDETLGRKSTAAQRQRAIETLMRTYGITGIFVDFKDRSMCFNSDYNISFEDALVLSNLTGARESDMFRYFKTMQLEHREVVIKGG